MKISDRLTKPKPGAQPLRLIGLLTTAGNGQFVEDANARLEQLIGELQKIVKHENRDAKGDANRGSRQVVMSTANSADVPVPTGLVIAWEPLPGYSAPVLVRLVSLPSEAGPQWQLVPVTLSVAARQLRNLLQHNLAEALGDAATVRLVLA